MKKKLALFSLSLVFALAASSQAAVILSTTYNWSADGSGETDQAGRLLRNAIQSTWASAKPNPGLVTFTAQDSVSFTLNTGVFSFIQVTVNQISAHNIFSVTYSSFTPADPAANYLADRGASGPIQVYQFVSAPSTNFDVTLSTVNGVGSAGGGQTGLLVEGFTSVPEPSASLLLFTGLALTLVRRRRP